MRKFHFRLIRFRDIEWVTLISLSLEGEIFNFNEAGLSNFNIFFCYPNIIFVSINLHKISKPFKKMIIKFYIKTYSMLKLSISDVLFYMRMNYYMKIFLVVSFI